MPDRGANGSELPFFILKPCLLAKMSGESLAAVEAACRGMSTALWSYGSGLGPLSECSKNGYADPDNFGTTEGKSYNAQ